MTTSNARHARRSCVLLPAVVAPSCRTASGTDRAVVHPDSMAEGGSQMQEGYHDHDHLGKFHHELTATSLEIMVSKGNHPQMALIHVSELL